MYKLRNAHNSGGGEGRHRNTEYSYELHTTNDNNEDGITLTVILNTLRAEEGKEQEEKVVYNREAHLHIIVELAVSGVDIYKVENVKENRKIAKCAGQRILDEAKSILFNNLNVLGKSFITVYGNTVLDVTKVISLVLAEEDGTDYCKDVVVRNKGDKPGS